MTNHAVMICNAVNDVRDVVFIYKVCLPDYNWVYEHRQHHPWLTTLYAIRAETMDCFEFRPFHYTMIYPTQSLNLFLKKRGTFDFFS